MWFIGIEVEKETSAPPPKKNPGSAPGFLQSLSKWALKRYENRDVSRVLLLPQWFKPTKLRRFCIED